MQRNFGPFGKFSNNDIIAVMLQIKPTSKKNW